MVTFVEIALAALIAGLLDTVAGFGGGLLLLPILVLLVGSMDAVMLTAIIPLGWNLMRIALVHQWIVRRAALLFAIGILPGTYLGASLLNDVDPDMLKTVIGVLLIIFGIYYIIRLYFDLPHMKAPGEWSFPIAGVIAGGISALLGAGNGPIQSWAFAAASIGPREISATNGLIGTITSFGRIISYGLQGMLHEGLIVAGIVGIVAAAAGSFAGVRLSLRAKDSTLELVLGAAILLAGVRMVM
jgi:uncharacterized membrane protein YfcA